MIYDYWCEWLSYLVLIFLYFYILPYAFGFVCFFDKSEGKLG